MDIFRDGKLIDVNVSFWSGAKMLTAEDLGLEEKDIASAYKLGRKLLIPEEVVHGFRQVEGKARYTVDSNSFRFPIGNARFIPKKKVTKVLATLKACQDEYNSLVDRLIENYDKYRAEMLPVYQEAANIAFVQQKPAGVQEFSLEVEESDKAEFVKAFIDRINSFYPTKESLRGRYSLNWAIFEIALPKMRKISDAQVIDSIEKEDIAIQEYRMQTQQRIQGFVDEVVKTLRQETLELCTRITSNIKEGKVIKGRTLNSLQDFVEKFKEFNFVGDSTVEDQLDTLKREFLDVHSNDDIAKGADLQEELKRRLGELAEVAANMTDINSVTGEYRRKISWEE